MEHGILTNLADGGSVPIVARNGATLYAAATRRGDWVDVTAPVEANAVDPWSALAANAAIRGSARITLASDRYQLRTERPWPATGTPIASDLVEAHHALLLPPVRPPRSVTPDETAWASWVDTLDGLPWKTTPREGHRMAIDLETGERFSQAIARPQGTALHLEARLATTEDDCCRLAIGRLLLAATNGVRLVRAAREADQVSLAATVPAGADLNAVDGSLAALRVAVRMTAREVGALTSDAPVARRYLQLTLTKERQCEWMAEKAFSCST